MLRSSTASMVYLFTAWGASWGRPLPWVASSFADIASVSESTRSLGPSRRSDAGERTPIAVLVSGGGTNLRALLDRAEEPAFPARIVCVFSNHHDAPALRFAQERDVPAKTMPVGDFGGDRRARDSALKDCLQQLGVQLVVCAGYDRLLSDELLDAYADAVLNVHPSLLPAFGGSMHAVEEALAYGVKVSGCTVQLLERGEPDGGPIILQGAVPVLDDDNADSLRLRIHQEEWELLPRAVALWCDGRLMRDGRHVRVVDS